jgi:hypothetical protein
MTDVARGQLLPSSSKYKKHSCNLCVNNLLEKPSHVATRKILAISSTNCSFVQISMESKDFCFVDTSRQPTESTVQYQYQSSVDADIYNLQAFGNDTQYDLSSAQDSLPHLPPPAEMTDGTKFSPHTKPVLEDLSKPIVPLQGFDVQYEQELELLWNKAGNTLQELQDHIERAFPGTIVKIDDIRAAVEKLIFQAQTRKTGSSLVSRFLDASRKKDFSTISNVFDTFVNQAERFAKVIVSERSESANSRLIADAQVGGVAGRSKFIAG